MPTDSLMAMFHKLWVIFNLNLCPYVPNKTETTQYILLVYVSNIDWESCSSSKD